MDNVDRDIAEAPLVELTAVSKVYPAGTAALEGFSFRLDPGEFVSLLGPSGCGKSTVLRLIAGLTDATGGRVHRQWAAASSAARPLGCVFQESTLLPWATVWNNAYLPLRIQGLPRRRARPQVDEALRLVGLDRFAAAYPRELSGGMKMRASVARALVARPQLLLLDEPFAALDEMTRSRLNDDLLAMWRSWRWTALFITHSVFEAVYLSTRVLVMSPRPGRVVEDIRIDLPRERSPDMRTSAHYADICRHVAQALERAAAPAAGAAS